MLQNTVWATFYNKQTGSPLPQSDNCEYYGIKFAGTFYNSTNNKTYFFYYIWNTDGHSNSAISHVTFGDFIYEEEGLANLEEDAVGKWSFSSPDQILIEPTAGSPEMGADNGITPTMYGTKFDEEFEPENGQTEIKCYYIEVAGLIPTGTTKFMLKTGQKYAYTDVPAPAFGSGILPVELSFFTAKRTSTMTTLEWATESEKDNDYFAVEASIDGQNWKTITEVSGKGNSIETTHYSCDDKARYPIGIIYYRLKQVDFDGTSSYSDIEVVKNEAGHTSGKLTIAPNPVASQFNIILEEQIDNPTITLINTLGQRLVLTYNNTGNGFRINLPSHISAGNYMVQINAENRKMVERIVVQ